MPREKRAGQYKDLTETGNHARKVSGTQGTPEHARLHAVCQLYHVILII